MKKTKLGQKIDNFELESTKGVNFHLKDFKGKNLVLYFYPKDDTTGCTQEGLDFNKNINKLKKLNAYVFGISRDSISSHTKFKEKYKFKFDLLSDEKEAVCKAFSVIKEKSMYGKKYMGVERSTFIINKSGVLKMEWRKVKVSNHVKEVINYLSNI
ncbi:MAG: peroxiredoxin [Gammaproteobacteria bacterium]|nr:peroxiredoxin [Gammaproteobacteria bacterium]|tara:strand:- start:8008 stop:8475 length:468 start_codon:yes stop_codon:yes gene_type:complete